MNLRDVYTGFNGDFEGTMARISSEALLKRLLIKFLDDKNMANLIEGVTNKDAEKAFESVHTLKGVALNLGFSSLAKSASDLTEKIRGRDLTGCEDLLSQVVEDYNMVVMEIKKMD